MRKVFDRQTYVRAIGEKEWHRTSVFKHLSYQEEKEITIKIIQYDNFKDTLRYVETGEAFTLKNEDYEKPIKIVYGKFSAKIRGR